MRIKLTPALRISRDADQKYLQFAPDETMIQRVIDTYLRQFNGVASVAISGTESLPLGDISAVRGLWLEASEDCVVKLNGAATGLQLRRAGTVGSTVGLKAMLLIEAEITQVEVTAGAAAVDVVYVTWGDVAP